MTARDLLDLAWIIPALPALGAVVLLLFGKRIGEPKAGWIATALMALAFVWSVVTFLALRSLPPEARFNVSDGFTWIQAGTFRVDFRFLADPLSTTMILFVTGVAALIHLYSIGYMHGDPRFSRFFAYLNLFAASMLVLVLGSSFLLTFMGWEGVGLCSYLLISFWFERNSAAVAGKKAFVTNRVGDFGFMLAMFLIFAKVGSLDYGVANLAAPHLSQTTVTAIALLLFVGAIGKSAQFPLHVWLPDAMEGPTPVSALIHAATMVTAGVFLVVRAHVFFDASRTTRARSWRGSVRSPRCSRPRSRWCRTTSSSVLAYSTISQLGYMFLAVGVGAYSRGDLPHDHARVLQGAAVPRRRLGDPRHARRAGHAPHGRPAQVHAGHRGHVHRRLARDRGRVPVRRLLVEGRDPRQGVVPQRLRRCGPSGSSAALATAFYMTRQVWLVFYGDERWQRRREHMAEQ